MSRNNDARRNELQEILLLKEKASVEEFATLLHVSIETIRNDLRFLESKGFLYRTHGGATLRNANIDIPMEIRKKENIMQKKEIAKEAIHFINDDDIIYIDPSSTALFLGKLLRLKKHLTIVTNSFSLITQLGETKHKIIFVGGEYSIKGKRCVGQYALNIIDTIYYDVCILGMDGCNGIDGPANMDDDELCINEHIMKRSKKRILLSDASKFNKKAHFQYAKFSEFDILVTTQLEAEEKKRLSINKIVEV